MRERTTFLMGWFGMSDGGQGYRSYAGDVATPPDLDEVAVRWAKRYGLKNTNGFRYSRLTDANSLSLWEQGYRFPPLDRDEYPEDIA